MKLNKVAQLVAGVVFALTLQSQVYAQTLRPEVGKPLQAAQELLKAGKAKEALSKVREAEGAAKSADEQFTVNRMRMAVAQRLADYDLAKSTFDALTASGKLGAADSLKMVELIAVTAYQAQKYSSAVEWTQRYFREGGTSGNMRSMLVASHYQNRNFAEVVRELTAEINAAERNGSTPSEQNINMLMTAQLQMKDNSGYVWAMEKLVTYYPKKEYWVNLLDRLQSKKNFSDRFALDTYRLSLAVGALTKAGDYMEMAQLAVQAGYPDEGLEVMELGYKNGLLGTGSDTDRQKRLKDLIVKKVDEAKAGRDQAIKDAEASRQGDDLIKLGFGLATAGNPKRGIELINKGLAKAQASMDVAGRDQAKAIAKRADDGRLRLALAQMKAGDKASALKTFKTVTGQDGGSDLAHLWGVYLRRK
jgi:hypothetical protein